MSKHAYMYFIIVDVYSSIAYQLSTFSDVFWLIQSKIKICCISLLNMVEKLLFYK